MKKCMSFIECIGGVILSCLLAAGVALLFLGCGIFYPLIGAYKEIRGDWRRGCMDDVRSEIILFLIVWGPYYFTMLYLIYDYWRN